MVSRGISGSNREISGRLKKWALLFSIFRIFAVDQMQTFISVPFKSEHGISQVHGLAKFSSAGIVLEYESKIIGLISTGLKDANIPIEELLDVKYRKSFGKKSGKIEIRLKSFRRLAELPNQQG